MLFQDYLESIGLKKDGFLKKILWVGFSGTVDFVMEEEFLIWMKFRLKDGKILEDMFQQLKRIVKKEIQVVEKDRDKQYYSGHMTLIKGKNQSPK